MIAPECGVPGCRRTVSDGAPICTHHAGELAERLREVPDLLDDMLVTISRQDRIGAGGKAGPPDEQPGPRLDVSRVLDALVGEITTWARDIAETYGLQIPVPDRPAQDARLHSAAVAADWLAEHAALIRTHRAALECHRALTAAIAAARHKADRPDDRTRFVVGPCPESDVRGRYCPGQVWAYIPTDQRDPAELRCSLCPATWDTTRWRRAGARIAARRDQLNEATG